MADDAKPDSQLQGEACERLEEAREWKSPWALDFQEGYFFTMPHRMRQITSTTQQTKAKFDDAPELQTSCGFEWAGDFVTEVVNTYMPEAQTWCERGRGMFIPQEAFDKVAEKVRAQDKQIFEAIKSSNLYSEIPKAFNPDLSIGTVGMWIDIHRPARPISCRAVPLRELEINIGPDGLVDDRFAVRWTRGRHIKSILPDGVALPKKIVDEVGKNPKKPLPVAFGFWKLWDRADDEWWQHVILVKDELVHSAQISGEGCCPLLVGRWNPTADWPWGYGPLIQAISDLRQKDELEGQTIEVVDRNLNPPLGYPDDSFTHVEQGVENGMAYPLRPGSEGAAKPLFPPVQIDTAILQDERMEHRGRRLFYIDYPEQTGDTPPTLGQWLDELARAQRRIGTPGMPFWREMPAEIFLRFKYLLERQGAIEPITVDGRAVSLRPMNPAQRAAEQQEIATATQFANIMSQMFPEEWRLVIDGRQTMAAFMSKMRVSGLIKVRDEQAVNQFVQQITPLILGRQRAGAPELPGGAVPTQ